MRRTAAATGTLAVVGLMAVGCGSSSSDVTEEVSTTTAAAPMTDSELSALLLTPDEVGSGWTASTSSSSGDSMPTPSCLKGVQGAGKTVADADGSYANGDTISAYEGLGAQASTDQAKSSWESVTAALDDCTDVTINSGGDTVSGSITSNGAPDIGDAARATA